MQVEGVPDSRLIILEAILGARARPDLYSFTAGLKQDHAAVLNGLTLQHRSGAVEGNVNRIKMIKGCRCLQAVGPLRLSARGRAANSLCFLPGAAGRVGWIPVPWPARSSGRRGLDGLATASVCR